MGPNVFRWATGILRKKEQPVTTLGDRVRDLFGVDGISPTQVPNAYENALTSIGNFICPVKEIEVKRDVNRAIIGAAGGLLRFAGGAAVKAAVTVGCNLPVVAVASLGVAVVTCAVRHHHHHKYQVTREEDIVFSGVVEETNGYDRALVVSVEDNGVVERPFDLDDEPGELVDMVTTDTYTAQVGEAQVVRKRKTKKRREVSSVWSLCRQVVVAHVGILSDTPANRLVVQRIILDHLRETKVRPFDVVRILPVAVELCFVPLDSEIMSRKVKVSLAAYRKAMELANVGPNQTLAQKLLGLPRGWMDRLMGLKVPSHLGVPNF